MPIGEIIKETRREKGLTQKELGDVVKVTAATIQKYESGVIKSIPIGKLAAISRHLGIPGEKIGITAGFSFAERSKLLKDLCEELALMEKDFPKLRFDFEGDDDDKKSYRKGIYDGYHAAINFILWRSAIKLESEE